LRSAPSDCDDFVCDGGSMVCVGCGHLNGPHDRVCASCGRLLPIPDDAGSLEPRAAAPAMADLSQLRGLGGWLILVGLGLCLGPVAQYSVLFRDTKLLLTGNAGLLADSYTAVHTAGYSWFLGFEVLVESGLLGANIWLLFLFFKKRYSFPRAYLLFLFASVAFVLLKYGFFLHAFWTASGQVRGGLDEAMSEQEINAASSILTVLIWSLYITKSKRVKATFVN
jgi:hypothetical protein